MSVMQERSLSRTEKRKRDALLRQLNATLTQLYRNENEYQEAIEAFTIEQLIYERAALMCRCRAVIRELKGR